jgi:hypothetical protein
VEFANQLLQKQSLLNTPVKTTADHLSSPVSKVIYFIPDKLCRSSFCVIVHALFGILTFSYAEVGKWLPCGRRTE